MRSYKPRHDTLWGYPRETQRLRPGTRDAHSRILKRCTGLALRLSGNAHTHHSSHLASHTIAHVVVEQRDHRDLEPQKEEEDAISDSKGDDVDEKEAKQSETNQKDNTQHKYI